MDERSPALVVDLGSGSIKAGLNNSPMPQTVLDAVLGIPEYYSPHTGCHLEPEIDPAGHYRGSFRLERVIERGKLLRKSHLPMIIRRIYRDFSVSAELGLPLFLTCPLRASPADRAALARNAFEGCSATRLFLAEQAVLPLFSVGRLDGFVIESGEDLTQVVAVAAGAPLPRTAEAVALGGGDVSARLGQLLRRKGEELKAQFPRALLDRIKQGLCECSLLQPEEARFQFRSSFYNKDMKKRQAEARFELPDGREIALGPEKHAAAEVLFNPWQAGLPCPGLAELADFSLRRLEPETRRFMCRNVLVSGGNTLLAGFLARLKQDLELVMPEKNILSVYAPDDERSAQVWKGGCALTQLSSFEAMWIGKREFEEKGERVFYEKSL